MVYSIGLSGFVPQASRIASLKRPRFSGYLERKLAVSWISSSDKNAKGYLDRDFGSLSSFAVTERTRSQSKLRFLIQLIQKLGLNSNRRRDKALCHSSLCLNDSSSPNWHLETASKRFTF